MSLLLPLLTHLTFGSTFDQPVDNLPPVSSTFPSTKCSTPASLPSYLTQLTFGRLFNELIPYLPHPLLHLSFGTQFNLPVNSLLPSLTHLTCGDCFNTKVASLPPSLTLLHFGCNFNQPVSRLPLSPSTASHDHCGGLLVITILYPLLSISILSCSFLFFSLSHFSSPLF